MVQKLTYIAITVLLPVLGTIGANSVEGGFMSNLGFAGVPSCMPRLTLFGQICDPVPAGQDIIFPRPIVLPTPKPISFPHPTTRPVPVPSPRPTPSICAFDPCVNSGPIRCLVPAFIVACDDPRCNVGPCQPPVPTVPPFGTGLQQIQPFAGTAGSLIRMRPLAPFTNVPSCMPFMTPFGPMCQPLLIMSHANLTSL